MSNRIKINYDALYSTSVIDGNKQHYISIPPIDELCLMLKTKFRHQEERYDRLEEEYDELRDEKFSEKKLQEMSQELKLMEEDYYRGFPISEEEEKDILAWRKQHETERHNNPKGLPRGGASGGAYTYLFYPTAIGTAGAIQCTCGEKYYFREL